MLNRQEIIDTALAGNVRRVVLQKDVLQTVREGERRLKCLSQATPEDMRKPELVRDFVAHYARQGKEVTPEQMEEMLQVLLGQIQERLPVQEYMSIARGQLDALFSELPRKARISRTIMEAAVYVARMSQHLTKYDEGVAPTPEQEEQALQTITHVFISRLFGDALRKQQDIAIPDNPEQFNLLLERHFAVNIRKCCRKILKQ